MGSSVHFLVAQPRPYAVLRLFCFPHAGGGPSAFFPWLPRIGPDIECLSVQYPGRGQKREQPFLRIEEMVRGLSSLVTPFTDKPFAFYGHSFGGLVAFELARRLRQIGVPGPERLLVAASRPPHLPLTLPPIHRLPDDEFVEVVRKRYGGIPAAILEERDMLRIFVSAMRADFAAYELYRMEEETPLPIPITAFAGADDVAVTPVSMKEWALHTSSEFELRILPGGHFFPSSSLPPLIDAIRDRLLMPFSERFCSATRGQEHLHGIQDEF